MNLSITGARLELGRVLAQQSSSLRGGSVHINLSGQQANTLLHDGHAWNEFPRTALDSTRRAIRAARTAGATLFVHASFAFVHAVERGARIDEPLRSCVDAILECESLALSGPLLACVARLGYLYGPVSADLLAYRKAFRLGRPYWSGRSAARHLKELEVRMLAAPDQQISLTDPDARSMNARGSGIVGYNVQTAVDAKEPSDCCTRSDQRWD